MKKKTIGILGGMGSEATLDMFRYIIEFTPVEKDQDHLPVLIYNNPSVPDRTASILNNRHTEIIHELTRSAKILEKGEADFIIMPCNTAHYYIEHIRKTVSIPVLNMIEETRNYIAKEFSSLDKIGLLATTGTLKTNLYQNVFGEKGIGLIIPDDDIQEQNVMGGIYRIKAGKETEHAKKLMREAVDYFVAKNSTVIIMGCTEVPLLLERQIPGVTLINPSEIIVKRAIRYSLEGV